MEHKCSYNTDTRTELTLILLKGKCIFISLSLIQHIPQGPCDS